MSWKECWSRPIDVLDGKERHALRKISALKSSPCAQLPDSPTCASRNARMLRNSCSNVQVSSQPPFALPFLSVVLCHTLRVCLENTLTVPGDQLPIGECVFFLHTISEQDLHLLSVHGSAIWVALVCYVPGVFGGHALTFGVPFPTVTCRSHSHHASDETKPANFPRQLTFVLRKVVHDFLA